MSPIAFKGNPDSATEFPVAPAGKEYFLKVRNAQEKVSKTSGRDMIATEYVIAEGEYEGPEGDEEAQHDGMPHELIKVARGK